MIFISYNHVNTNWAQEIQTALEAAGYQCFMSADKKKLGPREDWHNVIWKAIKDSQVFVGLVTEAFISSPYCQQEMGAALALDMPRLCLLRDVSKPPGFESRFQACPEDMLIEHLDTHPDFRNLRVDALITATRQTKDVLELVKFDTRFGKEWDGMSHEERTRLREAVASNKLFQREANRIGVFGTAFSWTTEGTSFAVPEVIKLKVFDWVDGVAVLKKLIQSSEHIEITDRVDEMVQKVVRAIESDPRLSISAPVPNLESITDRLKVIDEIIRQLAASCFALAKWGNSDHETLVRKAISKVGSVRLHASHSYEVWQKLSKAPASYLYYATGLGAMSRDRYEVLWRLLSQTRVLSRLDTHRLAGTEVSARYALPHDAVNLTLGKRRLTPGSDWLLSRLTALVSRELGGDADTEMLFNRFELYNSMAMAMLSPEVAGGWMTAVPDGRYKWAEEGNIEIYEAVKREIDADGDRWPPLLAGMFEGSRHKALEALGIVQKLYPAGWH